MRDDDPTAGEIRREFPEPTGHVLVRQAVEAVAPHTLVVAATGDRVAIRDSGMAAVERRVEAGDLRHRRVDLHRQSDRGQVVGLV